MLCNAMGAYGDALCAFHADRNKRITNKEGRNRQERERKEEDDHPPLAELRISPEKSRVWKELSLPCGIQADMFAVWKWNFRSWLSVFWCLIRVDRPHWKLFVCTHVEPPDVSFSSTHCKNSMVPSQGFTDGLHS